MGANKIICNLDAVTSNVIYLMERAGTLINRLREQYEQNVSASQMAVTTQLLLAELQLLKAQESPSIKKISVLLPKILQKENRIEDEYVAINQVAEEKKLELEKTSPVEDFLNIKSGWRFDPIQDIPTLAHQQKNTNELNETMARKEESMNDRLKTEQNELGNVLQVSPVRDLKKAIGINDRFLFINELFRGDESTYERSIKTINSFSILPEAEYWIKRELKVKQGWDEQNETVKLFDQIIKRRFS